MTRLLEAPFFLAGGLSFMSGYTDTGCTQGRPTDSRWTDPVVHEDLVSVDDVDQTFMNVKRSWEL